MEKNFVLNIVVAIMLLFVSVVSSGPARAGAPAELAMHLQAVNRDYPADLAQVDKQEPQVDVRELASTQTMKWTNFVLPVALTAAFISFMMYTLYHKRLV